MGYLFVAGIIGLWGFMFLENAPQISSAIVCIGWGLVAFIWYSNWQAEKKYQHAKEKRERERIEVIKSNFALLNTKLIVDSERRPWAFQSDYDAQKFIDSGIYTIVKSCGYFFVLSGNVTHPETKTHLKNYLIEFYNVSRHPQNPRNAIHIRQETADSVAEKRRADQEKLEQRQRIVDLALDEIECRTKEDVGEWGTATYVMASKHGVKIGISDNPDKRLGQVQTGHPAKVRLFKAFWFFTRQDAIEVEKTLHDLLKVRGSHALVNGSI